MARRALLRPSGAATFAALALVMAVAQGYEWQGLGQTPAPENLALLEGAKKGEGEAALKKHLDFGANIDARDHNGRSSLILAVLHQHTDTAKALVRAITLRAHAARPALARLPNLAGQVRCSPRRADPIVGVSRGVLLQINLGASVTLADQDNDSPLHLALKHGSHQEVRSLQDQKRKRALRRVCKQNALMVRVKLFQISCTKACWRRGTRPAWGSDFFHGLRPRRGVECVQYMNMYTNIQTHLYVNTYVVHALRRLCTQVASV